MLRYITTRLINSALLVGLVSAITFALIHSAPGLPTIASMSEQTPEERDLIVRNLGLNDPILIRYWRWIAGVVKGDFGTSLAHRGVPVAALVAETFPSTVLLSGLALLLAISVAIPLGIVAAIRHNSWVDSSITTVAFWGASIPNFWYALLLIIVFGVQLRLLPASGAASDGPFSVLDRIKHLIMPMLVLGTASVALLTRQTRSSLLEVLSADYVRTAHAKGLAARVVLARHALRNGMLPVVTLIGLQVPVLFGGSAIVETIFGWPGMGQLAVSSAFQRDYPTVMAITVLMSAIAIASSLIVDLSYGLLDPRIRYE